MKTLLPFILGTLCIFFTIGCKSINTHKTAGFSYRESADSIKVYIDKRWLGENDVSTELEYLNECLSKYADKHVVIYFPKGKYYYRNNSWLALNKVTVEGNGSYFVCINNIRSEDCRPINIKGPHRLDSKSFRYDYYSGDKIKVIDNLSIELINCSRIYEKGDRVLISGFEQQFEGYPPNSRFFQYTKVNRVKGNVLLLKDTIKEEYSANWKDYSWGTRGREIYSGSPRILNLDKSEFIYPEYVMIKNATFGKNPFCDVRDALVIKASKVILDNVTVPSIYPSVNEYFEFRNGVIKEYIEFDKLLDTAILKNSIVENPASEEHFSNVRGGTSVNTLILESNTFYKPIRLSPRNLVANDNTFKVDCKNELALFGPYNNFFPIYNTFINKTNFNNECVLQNFDKINEYKSDKKFVDELSISDTGENRNILVRSITVGQNVYSPEARTFGKVERIEFRNNKWVYSISWENDVGLIQKLQWNALKFERYKQKKIRKRKLSILERLRMND